MNNRWIIYLFVLLNVAVLTIVALVGYITSVHAINDDKQVTEQLKTDVAARRCEHLVLADAIHTFHVSLGKLEANEHNKATINALVKQILNEPDIKVAMEKCAPNRSDS